MARQQRHEGVAGQAEAAQQAVHDEGSPGQITGVLKQADEEEKQTDLRQENDRARDTADHTVDQEVAHRAGR